MSALHVVGYTYRADNYHGACVLLALEGDRDPYAPVESRLDRLATMAGVDRDDEGSFDSGDFPKGIFAYQVRDDETCGGCGEAL